MSKSPRKAFIRVEVWLCGTEGHRHRSKGVAQACIDDSARPRRLRNSWNAEGIEAALKLRESGLTYREVGEAYGIGSDRARQVCQKAERLRRKSAGKPQSTR